ncbi:MAG: zeta toxin family protein [Coprothermobacterota bacterium]|nr:zeta toxin family protein [Coprothermobacterota bacterium]
MKRVVILAGPSGSGKSEISLNLALQCKQQEPVVLVDLDIIKPLFRLRNLRAQIEPLRLRFVTSGREWDGADMPVLPSQLGRWLESDQTVIIDLGGDGAGARVLAQYTSSLPIKETEMLFVANPNRPFARDAEECLAALRGIEANSGIPFTALVSNPHLKEYTALSTILDGHYLVEELSRLSGLPIACIAVREDLAPAVRARLDSPRQRNEIVDSGQGIVNRTDELSTIHHTVSIARESAISNQQCGDPGLGIFDQGSHLRVLPLQIWIRPPWELATPGREGGE